MSIDLLAINTIRCLSADQVQAANSGHPGAPMGCAPIAHALFGYVMRFNPRNPNWWARDRFVLSNGHACALLYSMLHLSGYDLPLQELRKFRQMDSRTPGHPERNVTPGVELTTGPLGQGLASAVGLALAQSHMAATYPNLFDNYTYVICGDGCLQEGVTCEAAALAGHWRLGRLIVIYDDNNITIDGDTHLSFTEDVTMRFESYGWEVRTVQDGDTDFAAIKGAVEAAKSTPRPTLIRVKTTIGFGSVKQGTEKTHGSPLGPDDLQNLKSKFGFDPHASFNIPEQVTLLYQNKAAAGVMAEAEWLEKFAKFAAEHPLEATKLKSRFEGHHLEGCIVEYPVFVGDKATRATSGDVLASLVNGVSSFMGGSADLTESTLSNKANLSAYTRDLRGNRYLHFGVREHAMTAIANGLHAYGGLLPFVSTFANFISYCWPSLRLAALSHHQVLFLATHDSIDLGEDGPTHQPIEILSLVRATPNILDMRPADGNETLGAYKSFMLHSEGPSVLFLSRSAVPQLQGSSAERTTKGAYVLSDYSDSANRIILAGSGTEVSILVSAKVNLEAIGISARVVSFPSWAAFSAQPESYQREVFPVNVPVLLVEAARILGWERWADDAIEMTTFGGSAPAKNLKERFGFTVQAVTERATKLVGKKN